MVGKLVRNDAEFKTVRVIVFTFIQHYIAPLMLWESLAHPGQVSNVR